MTAKGLWFPDANTAKFTPLGIVHKGQDGAIWNGCVFRFNGKGQCWVYNLTTMEPVGEFTLDKADILCPHSNSVFFGTEYFDDGDAFPLLYSNIYNNYPGQMAGTCCAYRITRSNGKFTSQLVQVIRYAVIVLSSLPIMCLYPLLQKYFVQGVMIGSLKG